MLRWHINLALAGLLCISGCQNSPQQITGSTEPTGGASLPSPGSQKTAVGFVEAYKDAHRKGDVDAALKLVYWDGVDARGRQGFVRVFTRDFKLRLVDAGLKDITNPGPQQVETPEGILRTNLEPTKELKVSFAKENAPNGDITARTWPVGVVDGKYYFGATVKAK